MVVPRYLGIEFESYQVVDKRDKGSFVVLQKDTWRAIYRGGAISIQYEMIYIYPMEVSVDEDVVLAMLSHIKFNWVPMEGVYLLARAMR